MQIILSTFWGTLEISRDVTRYFSLQFGHVRVYSNLWAGKLDYSVIVGVSASRPPHLLGTLPLQAQPLSYPPVIRVGG